MVIIEFIDVGLSMKILKTVVALLLLHFSITNLYIDDTLVVALCLVGIAVAIAIIYQTFKTNIIKIFKNGI